MIDVADRSWRLQVWSVKGFLPRRLVAYSASSVSVLGRWVPESTQLFNNRPQMRSSPDYFFNQ
jgi:hypothetical protein